MIGLNIFGSTLIYKLVTFNIIVLTKTYEGHLFTIARRVFAKNFLIKAFCKGITQGMNYKI